MSSTFSSQMTFGWVEDTNVASVSPAPLALKSESGSNAKTVQSSVRRAAPIAATAKPMDELIASKATVSTAGRRNRTEHVSDLLLVVLENYGIDADEFLAGLNK